MNIQVPNPIKFQNPTPIDGALTDVSVGNHTIIGVNKENEIFSRVNNQWVKLPGAASKVSVGSDETTWVVNATGDMYRLIQGQWHQVAGVAHDVSVGSALHVAHINAKGMIYRFVAQTGQWDLLTPQMSVSDVSVGSDGTIGVVGQDGAVKILKAGEKSWQVLPGALVCISVADANLICGCNAAGEVYLWDGAWQKVDAVKGKQKRVSIGTSKLWVVGNDDKIQELTKQTVVSATPMMAAPMPMMGAPNPMMGGPTPMMGGPTPMMGGPTPMMGGPTPMMGGPTPMMGGPTPMMGGPQIMCQVRTATPGAVSFGFCPKKHALQMTNDANGGYRNGFKCDSCGTTSAPLTPRAACAACGYDLCLSCSKAQTTAAAQQAPINFPSASPVDGELVDVSVGGTTIYGTNAQNQIWQRVNGSWQAVPGALSKISVGNDDSVFGVNASQQIFQKAGTEWKALPGAAVDVSCGSSTQVVVVNAQGQLFRLINGAWQGLNAPSPVTDVSVGSDGTVGAVAKGTNAVLLLSAGQTAWTTLPGALVCISVSDAKTVVGCNASGECYLWQSGSWVRVDSVKTPQNRVSIGGNGTLRRLWVVGTDNKIQELIHK